MSTTGLCSMALHLVWNSAIFPSFPFVSYDVLIATSDYKTNNTPWSGDRTLEYSNVVDKNFTQISPGECLQRYVDPLVAYGSVVVVIREPSNNRTNMTSLVGTFMSPTGGEWYNGGEWTCSAYPGKTCNPENLGPILEDWHTWGFDNMTSTVEYCLSQSIAWDKNKRCALHLSPQIMWIVCGFNFMIFACFSYLAISHGSDHTLVTIGDAFASFLTSPDPLTRDMCLQDAAQVKKSKGKWSTQPVKFRGPLVRRAYSIITKKRWVTTMSL